MMIKSTILCLFMLSLSIVGHAQQETLFNKEGDPLGYIDFKKDKTLFTWEGKPVSFLKAETSGTLVMGFNGKQIGWYENGQLYDLEGYQVATKKEKLMVISKFEGIKGIQEIIPIKPITIGIYIKPIFFPIWSEIKFQDFLYSGIAHNE